MIADAVVGPAAVRRVSDTPVKIDSADSETVLVESGPTGVAMRLDLRTAPTPAQPGEDAYWKEVYSWYADFSTADEGGLEDDPMSEYEAGDLTTSSRDVQELAAPLDLSVSAAGPSRTQVDLTAAEETLNDRETTWSLQPVSNLLSPPADSGEPAVHGTRGSCFLGGSKH
ncbi:hypothetical protein BESB_046860 [Besnoitia besnoiti]|uniref:Uncharacterized protein n=1 Tax=Besnoitia besnoiti TaxID=94643 RepID=A0A2A9MH55_BESBE|nr:hypothetical protein BESB_046860 [Besnoitia besnoiti]PFH36494.1 hypothetical protein BESB_046860 [Besnoitia besnoiti]